VNEELNRHFDTKREWLRQNEGAYLDAVERIKETLPDAFLRVCRTLGTAIPEDPSRSHWIVAQCRMIVAEMEADAKLVADFKKTKQRLAAFDIKKAQEGAA
jgi:hypothetical protein